MLIAQFSLLLCFYFVESQKLTQKGFIHSKSNKLDLLKWDKQLISNLEEYADKLEDKIKKLKQLATEIRKPLNSAKGREEEYLSNPLHSFPLIRHLHVDWTLLEAFMKEPVGQEQIDFLSKTRTELPDLTDFKEAENAFERVEYVYKLNTSGFVQNMQYNISYSPLDCYSIGIVLFERGKYQSALNWLSHGLGLLPQGEEDIYEMLGLKRTEMIMLIVRTLIEMGLEDDASITLNKEPSLRFNASQIIENYKAYPHLANPVQNLIGENHAKLCRGEHSIKPSRLHCIYNTTTTPFLRLAPLKMEELSKDPYIVVYHNILYDAEIAALESIASPLLEPTSVYVRESNRNEYSQARTADGAWVPHEKMNATELKLTERIQQRLRDMTGLFLMDLNMMQILDYGFGGHYTQHYDYFLPGSQVIDDEIGDRIATAIFYLSDVPIGGYTVFPLLGLAVKPEKGKLLFWYNLNGNNYDYDKRTLHGACPVVAGNKLAMTRWIHENEQMFIKPCYGKVPPARTFYEA